MTYDAVIVDSHVILPNGMVDKNIIIDGGRIVGISSDVPSCDHKINGRGLVSVPGPIDTHVHYGVYSPIDQAAQNRVACCGDRRNNHHDEDAEAGRPVPRHPSGPA